MEDAAGIQTALVEGAGVYGKVPAVQQMTSGSTVLVWHDNGDGTWRYVYALYNYNSDRGARHFAVPVGSGASVTNIGFHDVDHHSGEIYDGTDWATSPGSGGSPKPE